MQRKLISTEVFCKQDIADNLTKKNQLCYGLSLVHSFSESSDKIKNLITELQFHFYSTYRNSFHSQQRPHATITSILLPRVKKSAYERSATTKNTLAYFLNYYPDSLGEFKSLKNSENLITYKALNSINSYLKSNINFKLENLKIEKNGNVVLILEGHNSNKLIKLRSKLKAAGAEQKYTASEVQNNIHIVVGHFNKNTEIKCLDSLRNILAKYELTDFKLNRLTLVEIEKTTQEKGFYKDLNFFVAPTEEEKVQSPQIKSESYPS